MKRNFIFSLQITVIWMNWRESFLFSVRINWMIWNKRKWRESFPLFQRELIERLTRKIRVLRNALQDVEEEIKVNEEIGASLLESVKESKAPPAQKNRYERHVVEIGRVVNLQLKLEEQLSRIECAMEDAEKMNDEKEKVWIFFSLL